MRFDDFKRSVAEAAEPPAALSSALQALWWDAKGDWTRAHDACQQSDDNDSAWAHAYLHRAEGDDGNARYWYARCRRPFCSDELSDEWEAIARELLGRTGA